MKALAYTTHADLGGQMLPDGSIKAPVISFERSMALYTAKR